MAEDGSDTTAVAIATKIHADKCEIYKDVDGVYNNDPKVDNNAIKYESLNFDDMLTLSNSGAKILQNTSVEIAKDNNMPIFIKSIFTNKIGTIIGENI